MPNNVPKLEILVKRLAALLISVMSILSVLYAQDRGLAVATSALQNGTTLVGRQYAVFIAIDSYREWLPLQNPMKDAKAIRDILQSRYFVDEVIELYDRDATKASILRLFDRLIETLKPEDSVLIYYAGHGFLDKTDTGFWIPVDAGTDRFEQSNWIPNVQIRNVIGKIKARQVALISDSCFSGDLIHATRGSMPEINQVYFRNAWSRMTRQVMTSGALETVPDASEFSRQLRLTLERNTSPYLDLFMLFNEVRLGTTKSTPLIGNLKDSGHQDGGSFILFLREQPEPVGVAATPPARPTGELYITTSTPGAEIRIDGIPRGTSPVLVGELVAGKPVSISATLGSTGSTVESAVIAGTVTEVFLALKPLTGNLLLVAPDPDLLVHIDGKIHGPLGTGLIRDIPVGSRSIELYGSGVYHRSELVVEAGKTIRQDIEPQPVGNLAVDFPQTARVSLVVGQDRVPLAAPGNLNQLRTGTYTLEWRIGTYQEKATIQISKGQLTRFTILPPGTVEIRNIPSYIEAVSLGDQTVRTNGRSSLTIVDLRPEQDVRLVLHSGTDQSSYQIRTSAETTILFEVPVVPVVFPWLPDGTTAMVNSQKHTLQTSSQGAQLNLLAMEQRLELWLPGIGTYTEQLNLTAVSRHIVTGHFDLAIGAMQQEKLQAEKRIRTRQTFDRLSWPSLALGVVSLLGSGVAYYLGQEAYQAYTSSNNPEDTLIRRKEVELYQSIFLASASLAGTAIMAAPVFRLASNGQDRLQAAANDMDRQIQELRRLRLARKIE
jgi:hypothetical protein